MGRQLDPGDRVGLAKDDTIEVQIEVHPVPPLRSAPTCRVYQ
jgi:hypothetical protein